MRKYFCNESFFDELNEKSAYWLGFIAGDGCVRKHNYSYILKIALATADIDHLNKFKNDIEFTGNIYSYIVKNKIKAQSTLKKDFYNSSIINITSKKIFNTLGNYNIIPRKTYSYSIPKEIVNNKNLRHFIRGCIDADGSIIKRNNSESVSILFVGNKDFVNDLFNLIKISLNINSGSIYSKQPSKVYKNNSETLQCEFSKIDDVTKILKWLYDDATIYLDRKKEIADLHDPNSKIPKDKFIISKEKLESIYNKEGSFIGAAKVLNVDEKTIKRHIKKNNIDIIDNNNVYNDFFEKNNELSNYWLGFFAGKANLIKDRCICLYTKNKFVLDSFIKDSEMKINISKNKNNYYFITIHNKAIVNFFIKSGFNIKNKESNYIIPDHIYKSNNIRYFISGYFKAKATFPNNIIRISGCKELLIQLNSIFGNSTNIKSRNKCYSVFYKSKKDKQNVINYISINT